MSRRFVTSIRRWRPDFSPPAGEEAIQAKPIAAGANGAEGEGERVLDVIVAGSLPPNPAELLESEAMGEALAQLRERYELVVIDTTPIGVVANGIRLRRGGRYGYGYYGGYYGRAAEQPAGAHVGTGAAGGERA